MGCGRGSRVGPVSWLPLHFPMTQTEMLEGALRARSSNPAGLLHQHGEAGLGAGPGHVVERWTSGTHLLPPRPGPLFCLSVNFF